MCVIYRLAISLSRPKFRGYGFLFRYKEHIALENSYLAKLPKMERS